MTKYVLNSGSVGSYPVLVNKFFAEVVDGPGDIPTLPVHAIREAECVVIEQ